MLCYVNKNINNIMYVMLCYVEQYKILAVAIKKMNYWPDWNSYLFVVPWLMCLIDPV